MSLKEQTKELYKQYGLSDFEFQVYLAFLGFPQSTVSEVAGMLEKEPEEIQPIADKLEEMKFIRKIKGIIDRYIPLEPYLALFNKQSEEFRNQIGEIKDQVLADQSSRFENLENIEKDAVGKVESAVSTQIDEFFKDTDEHDVDKRNVLESADKRFTETSKNLENEIQKALFAARDRFNETGKNVEKAIQEKLFAGRDRYENSSKDLEKNLHQHIDDNYNLFETAVNELDKETDEVWDNHSNKFTTDNENLNKELDEISAAHISQTESLEQKLHGVIDGLNAQLKEIADSFQSKYDSGIQDQKNTLNQIVDDLLKDMANRVSALETELKKDLDAHVDHHKEHAESLKPKLEEILDKYILRMKKVLEDLIKTVSGLLGEHVSHMDSTTTQLKEKLHQRVEERQEELAQQVATFEKNTVILIDNLYDISQKLSELGKVLSSRGSAWKALFLGRHKVWQERYEEIQTRISRIGGSMKEDFKNSTANYISETKNNKQTMQNEIANVISEEFNKLKQETDALDQKQKENIRAELEGLASELSSETDATLQHNIDHCKDTTLKLKDSVEKSLHDHHEEYELAINKHRQNGLKHYDTSNQDVKDKVSDWYKNMDRDHARAKSDITAEKDTQIRDVNDYLKKSKDAHTDHAKEFTRDTKDVKDKQRRLFDEKLRAISDDFKNCKTNVSDKINEQIQLIKDEVREMDELQHQQLDQEMSLFQNETRDVDDKQHKVLNEQIDLFHQETTQVEEKLHAMLEDHKAKYKDNATNLQQQITKTVQDNIQNVKDAIADFTLNFMNSIDEAVEKAEENEAKLSDIAEAATKVPQLGEASTWHVFGTKALLEAIIDAMWRTKSTITIITPQVEPKILETMSQVAYKKKSARFLYTTSWDLGTFGPIIEKMKVLGNIQFRNLKGANDFYAVSRDSEEIVLCPKSKNEDDMIAIVSIQSGFAQLFNSFIFQIFQANSRPI